MMEHPAYSRLYAFYDQDWGNWSCQYLSLLKKVFQQLPTPSKVLDIACGTGALAALLSEMGHCVTGIDLSPEMIWCACSKNIPGAVFEVQDMTRFNVNGKYDLAINTFDAFNYMLEREGVECFFKNVFEKLKPKSFLIFDFNTENLYTYYHKGEIIRDINGVRFKQLRSYSKEKNLAVTIFEFPDGEIEKHFQRAYSLEDIKQIYESTGFKLENAFGGFNFESYNKNSLRCICVLRKPGQKIR
ncbi:MAG: class I SAM-dependent methyltransferase [Fibrobacter sp.]|nr:class I SAM-dependent methyltransferase [Fibrobacter sp.]